MPVSRFQVTFTDDARRPKVATFGGSPLVNWYAYIRDPDGKLYLQREENGVLAPEITVIEGNVPPVGQAESEGITGFDFIYDPVDPTQAHLYFLADGTLYRVTVTSSPIGEEPTTQQFDRTNNRFDVLSPVFSTGMPFESFSRISGIEIPSVYVVETGNPSTSRVIIIVPPASVPLFDPDFVELVVMPNGGDGVLDNVFAVPPSRIIIYDVPANSVDFTTWAARSVRLSPSLKSGYSRAIDDGNYTTDAPQPFLATGLVFEGFVRKVNRQPVKRSLTEPGTVIALGTGQPFEGFVRKIDRQPVKTSHEEPGTTLLLGTGFVFEGFVTKNTP